MDKRDKNWLNNEMAYIKSDLIVICCAYLIIMGLCITAVLCNWSDLNNFQFIVIIAVLSFFSALTILFIYKLILRKRLFKSLLSQKQK